MNLSDHPTSTASASLRRLVLACGAAGLVLTLAACGNDAAGDGSAQQHPGGMPPGMGQPPAAATAAVPVRVAPVERRSVARYLETNGVLEAENEVDVVARVSGPVVEILTEEGRSVKAGDLLARIDDRETRNQVAIAKVNRDEAKLAFDRASSSWEQQLIAQEAYDAAQAKLEATEAQLRAAQLQLDYTRIRAPFDGLVVNRYIKLAQNVSVNTPLFRLSDFTPLLCPIQVPEKELPNVRVGQPARLELDAFPNTSFTAHVLRISPTIDAATGTMKVTLDVDGRGVLRPGLFASVFLETARHDGALVIPKQALVMDSIGDTVYVLDGDTAARREIRIGYRESDDVEVLDGLAEGEQVVVLGQESLSDGTPVTILRDRDAADAAGAPSADAQAGPQQARPGAAPAAGPAGAMGGMPPQFAERIRNATPEQLERIKERMRQRGMSDAEIEQRLAAIRGTAPEKAPEQR